MKKDVIQQFHLVSNRSAIQKLIMILPANTLLLKLFLSDRLFDQFATNYFTLSQNMCVTQGLV